MAYPKSTQEVSKIAVICHKYRIPIIPFSGGSSLEGNFSAPYGGVSVDFAYMDQIVQFHEEDMDIVVQPSVSWMSLNEELARRQSGLFFPVDPGPSAKIGGMVGTNCSGTNAVRYGTMKDWVINLTVVLADGTIIKTKRRPRKTSAGYNLNSLFVGSEGTLGLVTEITLKLAVVPQEFSVAVVTFPSIRDAASAAVGFHYLCYQFLLSLINLIAGGSDARGCTGRGDGNYGRGANESRQSFGIHSASEVERASHSLLQVQRHQGFGQGKHHHGVSHSKSTPRW